MHLRIPPLPVAALTLLALLPGSVASGDGPPATDPSAAEVVECSARDLGTIVYTLDHPTGGPPPAPVALKDGQRFTIRIANTLPTRFVYKLYRQRAAGKPGETLAQERQTDVCLTEFHDKQFAGYTLVVRPAEGGVSGYPSEVVVSIPVQTIQWTYGFAGAFVGSGLTDPVYFVRSVAQADGTSVGVVERSDEEDWAKLGTAAFVHATPPDWALALTFGIGISNGDKPTYYLGPSVRLGDQAFVTAGLAVGAVNALPAGIAVGSRVDDPNALANLRTRNAAHVFVALSYAFLGGRKALEKPFAPTPGDEAAAAGGRPRSHRRR